MAISLPKTFLSINHQLDNHHVLPSEKCCPVSFSDQKSHLGRTKSMEFATRPPRVPRVLSKTSESLSSIINELEKERKAKEEDIAAGKEEERRVADVWTEIHGQDDWVGMNANWIGYVAVSNDEISKSLGRRDITIAWRGTVTRLEWIADLMDFLKPISSNKIPCPDSTVKVESGFLDLYTDKDENCRFCKFSAREQILTEVKRLLEMYQDEEISINITGHSLGSALAILSAYDIVETGVNVLKDSRAVPVSVFSFSAPRVGNVRFKERIETLGVKVLRVVNVHDIVPKSPGLFFNENVSPMLMKLAEGLPWSYSHVEVELALDHKNSPFLKQTGDLTCAHNLEAHLHLLDGYHGRSHRFVLASGRDPALVNKASDFLKDHYLVPPYWRQDENKGMVRNNDGRWMQPERPKLDDHPEDIHHHLKQLGLASEH
ncbi:hypothetical protein CRYUN_Cryun14cG0109000 [Craigia yunnanensis]